MSTYIHRLIQQGEHQQLDFKFEISDSRKIAKTLVAFANTDGGTLLIGVKDNGNIAGVRSEEEFYMVEAAATMYCKPRICFESKRWVIDGRTVLEVVIPKGTTLPYLAQTEDKTWMAYVRIADENILATSVHLKVWKKQTHVKGVLMEFSVKERMLLEYLEINESISLSVFCKVALVTKKEAESILANLICWGLVKINYSGKNFIYTLKK